LLKPVKLSWDSDFFDLSIGQVNLKSQNGIGCGIGVEGFDLVYVFSDFPLKNIKQYSYHGTRVKFNKILSEKNNEIIENIQLLDNDYYCEHKKEIKNLAYISGCFSRFNLDTQFGSKRFQVLYDQWIENTLNNIYDNIFLVYKQNLTDKPIAILTGLVNFDSNVSKVGLLGVDINERGKSIGSLILKYFENEVIFYNKSEIEIYTQIENINACNFYKGMGYNEGKIQYIYHLWS